MRFFNVSSENEVGVFVVVMCSVLGIEQAALQVLDEYSATGNTPSLL